MAALSIEVSRRVTVEEASSSSPDAHASAVFRAHPDRKMIWHLIIGEYPPDNGGVADYSRLVALAAGG